MNQQLKAIIIEDLNKAAEMFPDYRPRFNFNLLEGELHCGPVAVWHSSKGGKTSFFRLEKISINIIRLVGESKFADPIGWRKLPEYGGDGTGNKRFNHAGRVLYWLYADEPEMFRVETFTDGYGGSGFRAELNDNVFMMLRDRLLFCDDQSEPEHSQKTAAEVLCEEAGLVPERRQWTASQWADHTGLNRDTIKSCKAFKGFSDARELRDAETDFKRRPHPS